jgi:hypothetical protein
MAELREEAQRQFEEEMRTSWWKDLAWALVVGLVSFPTIALIAVGHYYKEPIGNSAVEGFEMREAVVIALGAGAVAFVAIYRFLRHRRAKDFWS